MSTETEHNELFELLDSSCGEMLLYFQEVTYQLARDSENLEEKLDSLFVTVGLTAANEHKEGVEVAEGVKTNLAEWTKKAKATPEYIEFSLKYGSETAEKLLGMSAKFSGNPGGIGADDYPQIMKHVYNGRLAFHEALRAKYPKIAAVVKEIRTTCDNDEARKEFSNTSREVINERGDFHLQQSILLARFTSFITAKDRAGAEQSSYYNVMEAQFSMVFVYFLVFAPETISETQERALKDSKKAEPDEAMQTHLKHSAARSIDAVLDEKKKALQQVGVVLEDVERGIKYLVDEKKHHLANAAGTPEAYKIALELAILQGERSFEIEINGKKHKQKVSSVIGFDTVKMTPLGRLKTVGHIESLKDTEDYKRCNTIRLKLALIEGDEDVNMIIAGKKQTQKVASIVGFNTAKMPALERLEKAEKVEALKETYATTLGINTAEELSNKMAALGDFDATQDPKKAKKYAVWSKGHAILNGSPEYQLQPRPNAKGERVFVNTMPNSEANLLHAQAAERRELYLQYCKENKKFFLDDGKSSATLLNFLGTIKHFLTEVISEKLKKPKAQKVDPCDVTNLNNGQQNPSQPTQLKKRSLSEIKLSTTASVGMFKPEPIATVDTTKVTNIPTLA